MINKFSLLSLLSLLGCNINGLKDEDEPLVCFETEVYEGSHYISPINTGVLRDKPVDIVPTNLFFNRLKTTVIWKYVDDVGKGISTLMNGYIFYDTNGTLGILGDTNIDNPEARITEIKYSRLNANKREHDLSEQEKQAMIEVINIVIDDKTKSTEIMKELYQKYLVKLKNNDTLTGGLLHTYVLYDGLQFEFWGVHRPTHKRAECVESNFTELVIQ